MVLIGLFISGMVVGAICSLLFIFISSLAEAEKYPLAAFLPAFLILFIENELSAMMTAGILVMGGFLGHYLIIALGKIRPKQEIEIPTTVAEETETRQQPTSLADYL